MLKHPVLNSFFSLYTASETTLGTLYSLYNTYVTYGMSHRVSGCQVLPNSPPSEAEDFPRGGKYSKLVAHT